MVFGIDVGGTTVKIGLVENDKIIDKYEIPTCGETFIEDVCNSLKGYMKDHNIDKIDGIGFGLPGNVIDNYIYNLADYLLANGVIVPPCKVGDTVYYLEGSRILEGTVKSFSTIMKDNYFVVYVETK